MPHVVRVGEAHHVLHQLLAAVVGRVRLAGDDELHRALGVEQEAAQPLRVAQHQRQALVRRDAPREADGEHVGVEDGVRPAELGAGGTALQPRRAQPAAHLVHQPLAQHPSRRPHVGGGDGGDPLPALRLLGDLPADDALAQGEDLALHPGRRVHAVGDRRDRDLGLVEARPQPAEHAARDRAVQLRDAVAALRHAQPHVRHVEDRRVVLGAELEHPLDRHVGHRLRPLGAGAEVAGDEVAREAVDAGRHRCVGGEDGAGAHRLAGLVEGQALLDELADALDAQEARVPLVHVEDLGLGAAAQRRPRAQGTHPADAEEHLLVEPVVAAAAVQPVGDLAHRRVVGLHVAVEQQQRHAPDLGQPQLGVQHAAVRHAHRHLDRPALGTGEQRQRQPVRVQRRVALLLPALGVERLLEVAGPVEQPDADDRHAQVAGRLEVVAGEDPEPAGVLRQHLGDAELR